MPAGQPYLLGQTGPLHRGQAVSGGHQPKAGAPRGRGGGGGQGSRRQPSGRRQGGGGLEVRGAAVLPCLGQAASLPGDLVQEVPVEAGVDAAEDVWPPGCGPDLPRLRQGGPLDVGDPGEEGVHLGGHVQPACQGLGVGGGGGWRAGSLSHTRPHQSTATAWGLPAALSPSKRVRRRCGRRCQQSGGSSQRTTRPCRVGRHSGAPVSSYHIGAKYQRHVYGRPALRASGRAARAKRTRGYLHCGAWPTVAPLVRNSGALGPCTADSQTGLSARWWWVCHHPF